MTREEFGLQLYDCITLIGGIVGLQQQIAGKIHYGDGLGVTELTARRIALRQELAVKLPQLHQEALKQVVERYPQVASL